MFETLRPNVAWCTRGNSEQACDVCGTSLVRPHLSPNGSQKVFSVRCDACCWVCQPVPSGARAKESRIA